MAQLRPVDAAYGSDRHGFVWAYLFSPGEPPVQIESDAVIEELASPSPGFMWLHFSLSNSASERWLRQWLNLTDFFYEALRPNAGSTRLEQVDDALIAVLHDVLFNISFDADNVSTVTLLIQPRLVVSARLRPLRSIERLRTAVKAGQSFRSSAELLAQLLRDQAAVLGDIVRQSTVRVDAIEDRLLANRVPVSRAELSSLRRSLVRLQRLLAPEPAALFRLLSRPAPWLSEDDLRDLRLAAEEFSTAVADSAALTERLKLLQEELAELVNEQTNRTLFVLTLVTVLALPINVVSGVLSMNVGGMPLTQYEHGFWVVVGCLALVTGVLAYILLGRRRD